MYDNSDWDRRVITRERHVASPHSSTRAIKNGYRSASEEPPVSKVAVKALTVHFCLADIVKSDAHIFGFPTHPR